MFYGIEVEEDVIGFSIVGALVCFIIAFKGGFGVLAVN